MSIDVKICGLSDREGVEVSVECGADYLGFNFFERSPRYVKANVVADITQDVPECVAKVGVFVDPDDALLDQVLGLVRLNYIQLHGDESPERIDEVRLNYGVPVIKAIGVSNADDLRSAEAYTNHADQFLFDAKAPPNADRPGGNAITFSWPLMKDYGGPLPWFLAGGLAADTVAEAIVVSGASGVDVSSAVESSPGHKDPALIAAFLAAAKAAG